MNAINTFWQNITAYAWHQDIALIILLVMIVSRLLARFKSNALSATSLSLIGFAVSSFETILKNRPELAEEILYTLVSRRFGLNSLQYDLDADRHAQEISQQHKTLLNCSAKLKRFSAVHLHAQVLHHLK